MGRLYLFRSFWFYPILAVPMLAWSHAVEPDRSRMDHVWLIPIGVLLWTLIEYLLHRFAFHPKPSYSRLFRYAQGFHRAHHASPRDPRWIFARLRTSGMLSAVILVACAAVSGSWVTAAGLTVGVWAGFLYYECVHYRVHTSAAQWGLNQNRRRHFRHHFVEEGAAYGVTSPLWDVVFGTDTARRDSGPNP